jgi:hydroxyacylglutathione hydrolase
MDDGERLEMGEVAFEVLHTPGHTPEHISLLVTDRSRGDEPTLLLSGGALLVGDVARPDLIGGREQALRQARECARTLQEKILRLPDFVEVYPAHVAGSLCGGSIGSRLSTTIGYERRMNALLAHLSAPDTFVTQCLNLEHLPAVPPYWRRMRQLNQAGPPRLGVLSELPALRPEAFEALQRAGALVLDCRQAEAFAVHIPGALNVGLGPSFATWAGTVLPAEAAILLVLEDPGEVWEACWQLLRIGYDLPKGWLAGGMLAWRTAGKALVPLPQWTVWDLQQHREHDRDLMVLDVRQPQDWSEGHIAEALFITGAELPARGEEVSKDRPVAVICGSGYRSSAMASLLQHRGHPKVMNIVGGMGGWRAAGLKIVQD